MTGSKTVPADQQGKSKLPTRRHGVALSSTSNKTINKTNRTNTNTASISTAKQIVIQQHTINTAECKSRNVPSVPHGSNSAIRNQSTILDKIPFKTGSPRTKENSAPPQPPQAPDINDLEAFPPALQLTPLNTQQPNVQQQQQTVQPPKAPLSYSDILADDSKVGYDEAVVVLNVINHEKDVRNITEADIIFAAQPSEAGLRKIIAIQRTGRLQWEIEFDTQESADSFSNRKFGNEKLRYTTQPLSQSLKIRLVVNNKVPNNCIRKLLEPYGIIKGPFSYERLKHKDLRFINNSNRHITFIPSVPITEIPTIMTTTHGKKVELHFKGMMFRCRQCSQHHTYEQGCESEVSEMEGDEEERGSKTSEKNTKNEENKTNTENDTDNTDNPDNEGNPAQTETEKGSDTESDISDIHVLNNTNERTSTPENEIEDNPPNAGIKRPSTGTPGKSALKKQMVDNPKEPHRELSEEHKNYLKEQQQPIGMPECITEIKQAEQTDEKTVTETKYDKDFPDANKPLTKNQKNNQKARIKKQLKKNQPISKEASDGSEATEEFDIQTLRNTGFWAAENDKH